MTGVQMGTSCMSPKYTDQLARRVLDAHEKVEPGISRETVDDVFKGLQSYDAEQRVLRLDVQTVLELSARHSRYLQDIRDALYVTMLDLFEERRALGLTSDIDLRYGIGISDREDDDTDIDIELDETLASGARISLDLASQSEFEPSRDNDRVERLFRTNGAIHISQPVLEGAGYEASHARLIQAEHNVVYDLRKFALNRQDFAIDTLRGFYDLIAQQKALANIKVNTDQSTFLRERSEAMFKVQMAPYIDVLRSQQQELSAQSRLSRASSALETAVRRYVVELGLPVDVEVELIDDIPALRPFSAEEDACIDIALMNRMEIRTGSDRLDDAQRDVRVAKRGMLPELNVFGRMRYVSDPDEDFPGGDFQDEVTAGVSLEVPLDKRGRRDALKNAQIQLAAAERDFDGQVANVHIDVIDNINSLRNLHRSVQIEERNNDIAEKRVRNAVLRFQNGELSNRDVVEAENELLDTRNRLIEAMLDHEIERLRLLRNMGLLEINAEGRVAENVKKAGEGIKIFAEAVDVRLPDS